MEFFIIPTIVFLISIILYLLSDKKFDGWCMFFFFIVCTSIINIIYVESMVGSAEIKETTYPIIKVEGRRCYISEDNYCLVEEENPDTLGQVKVKYALNEKTSKYFLPLDSVVLDYTYIPVDSLYMK